jgi:hypothetical protein
MMTRAGRSRRSVVDGGAHDEAGAGVAPGKRSLTDDLPPDAAAETAVDRVRKLLDELRGRASRLDVAIRARDFEAAGDAACLVDRFRHGLACQLEHAGDVPELRADAAEVTARLDSLMPLAPPGGREARHKIAWLARLGGSAGQPLPATVRGKLERTLGGADLSGVRVHPDDPSAAALGTPAYAVGQNIHFGPNAYDPDGAQGQQVLAHEVAHTVQQRGATVGSELATGTPGDAGEREAHAFAVAFASGAEAPITQRAPASIQRLEAMDFLYAASPVALVLKETGAADVIGDALGEAIASASAEAIAALVDNGEKLLRVLADVSVSLATLVIRLIVEQNMWILRQAIEAVADSALVRLIITALSDEQVQSFLWTLVTISTTVVRKIVLAIYESGVFEVVGRILFLLSHDQLHAILSNIGVGVLARLWRLFRDQLLRYLIDLLDEYWPTGMGITLGGHVGATFGYPIHLRGEYEASVSRRDDTNIHLYRRGEARAAADTGASAGAYVGVGGIGAGAQVGGNAQAGVKAIVIQEFDFPIFDEPETFLSLVFSFLMLERSVLAMIGEVLFGGIPEPMRYNTRTQFELRGYAQGAVEAEVGLKTPGENTRSGTQRGDSAPDIGKTPWWLKLAGLSSSIIGTANAEVGLGCELTQDWEGVTDRSQGPKSAKLAIFVGAEAGIELLHSLPLPFIPQLPKLGGAIGLRLNYDATPTTDDNFELVYQNMQLYASNGDLERYSGAGSEVTIEVTKDMLTSLRTFAEQIGDKQVTIRRRATVGTAFNQKLLRRTQTGLRSLLPNKRGTAFTLEGYVTFAFQMTGVQAKQILDRLIAAVGKVRAKNTAQVLSDLMDFLSTGEVPKYLASEVDAIAAILANHVTEIKLHGRSGITVAGGVHASAGPKVRLDYSASGYITVDKDLLAMLEGLTATEVAELLRDKLEDAAELVFPADGGDPIPLR